MAPREVVELGRGRLMLDLHFRDSDGLVASYLLPQEGGWTMVETGPSSCRAALLAGLAAAGVAPSEVLRVLVTHIHLDHAGGMGAIADDFPTARLFAHRLGVPHLLEPSRLVESARRAWGASSDRIWGAIVPVPAARLSALSGGERLPLTGGALEVIDTPGHARHHLAFVDTGTGALMSGDAAGVRLPGSWHSRPALPPPDLDLEALFASLTRMAAAHPTQLLYSHFGPSPEGPADLTTYRTAVEGWRDAALAAAREDPSVGHIARALRAREEDAGLALGHLPAAEDRGNLISGYELAAQGLLRYFRLKGLVAGEKG